MRRSSPPDDALARALRTVLDAPAPASGEHPSEAQIAAYLTRELSPDAIEHLERHFASCASCSDELLAATAVEDEVRAQSTRIADPPAVAATTAAATARLRAPSSPAGASAVRNPAGGAGAARVKRRSWLRTAASIAIVVGALAIAAAAGSRIVLGRLQPVLLDGMGGVLARKVTGADTSIVLAGGPGLQMNDVAIAEDPQFGTGSFAQIRRAALHLDPGALLRGQVRGAVHFDEPVVHLLRDPQGRWNVESLSGRGRGGAGAAAAAAGTTGTQAAREGKERLVRLTSASVKNGVLEISDRSGRGSDVTLRHVDLSYSSVNPQTPAAVTLAGTVGSGSQRIALRGEIGPFEGTAQPRYRFDEIALQSLPLTAIPGAPADLSGELTFSGTLASAGSGFDTVMANASGDGALGLCCGELRERNLSAELVAALTQRSDGDTAASADVLARARRTPGLAATLALDATPFQDISGSVTIANGKVSFQDLAVDTPLFQASATGSLSRGGALDASGTVALTAAATAAIVELLPEARRVFGAGTKLEVPFTVAGTWPNVRLKVDVRTALARLARPLDPRNLVLLPRAAG